jgi:hypothetical protein
MFIVVMLPRTDEPAVKPANHSIAMRNSIGET